MMGWRQTTFKSVRRKALRMWLTGSKRSRVQGCNDDYTGALECQWQGCVPQGQHCALFCGVGEWACHVTDVLSDNSCDNLRFSNPEHARRLFRQYARLTWFISELLNDFEDALKVANVKGNHRETLGKRVSDLHAFVNQVVKHKAKALHRHDHHLPLYFEDAGGSDCLRKITLGTNNFQGNNAFGCIVVPSFSELLEIAHQAYTAFDVALQNKDTFSAVCAAYSNSIRE